MELEQPTEIYIKKVLAGNSENVRRRLINSLETLSYDIVEEEPHIIARRKAEGWANWSGSANVLDYPRTLTIRLKEISEISTRVTFDYLVKHLHVLKDDKKIILQEAETIAALSKTQAVEKMCSACETESTDDSKFCRKCGSPLTSVKAELEVLRTMAETRAGKSSVVLSSILTPLSAILIILAFILNNAGLLKPKLFPVLLIAGGLGLLIGIISSFFGWNRLARALKKTESGTVQHTPRYAPPESLATGELPPRTSSPASITEGTTNLLDKEWKDPREKVPLGVRRTTNDLE